MPVNDTRINNSIQKTKLSNLLDQFIAIRGLQVKSQQQRGLEKALGLSSRAVAPVLSMTSALTHASLL
jgi:hypothetical protein